MKRSYPKWTVTVCNAAGTMIYAEMFSCRQSARDYIRFCRDWHKAAGFTWKLTRNTVI